RISEEDPHAEASHHVPRGHGGARPVRRGAGARHAHRNRRGAAAARARGRSRRAHRLRADRRAILRRARSGAAEQGHHGAGELRLALKLDLPATIHLLGETLGEVLREQESLALFQTEEEIRALAKGRRGGAAAAAPQLSQAVASLSTAAARATASAFALYFDLVNLAE